MTASLFWILNMKMTLNIVGADASVRSKQNNIKIFDKHKSEVVGVGVLRATRITKLFFILYEIRKYYCIIYSFLI